MIVRSPEPGATDVHLKLLFVHIFPQKAILFGYHKKGFHLKHLAFLCD